mmetsp:Transcript_118560/g.377929  ORF Transcript_118560/g.377929 Transcript_118560/m.377929 type:complete len:221 (+) Transcript_118560:1339-2001(+)
MLVELGGPELEQPNGGSGQLPPALRGQRQERKITSEAPLRLRRGSMIPEVADGARQDGRSRGVRRGLVGAEYEKQNHEAGQQGTTFDPQAPSLGEAPQQLLRGNHARGGEQVEKGHGLHQIAVASPLVPQPVERRAPLEAPRHLLAECRRDRPFEGRRSVRARRLRPGACGGRPHERLPGVWDATPQPVRRCCRQCLPPSRECRDGVEFAQCPRIGLMPI